MASSLLLLSQTHAKSALALQRIINLQPNSLLFSLKEKTTPKERLRATVRGALDNRTEADISDSAFLGKATKGPNVKETPKTELPKPVATETGSNPVDEMMELERELRNMDMTLAMGNSIASIDTTTRNRMKGSMHEGSFMVVPPGSNSYMSSSSMWTGANNTVNTPGYSPGRTGTAGVRARANRVQTILDASSSRLGAPPQSVLPPPPQQQPKQHSLESSWWGNSSAASQALTSSVISLASGVGGDPHIHAASSQSSANTKQLMRLMDALKTLGDENAALLREVEGAEAARAEAKAVKEQMRRFKDEYGKRFAALKEALEKFRKAHPGEAEANPVTSSEFSKRATSTDQLARQEQLIKKLTADLNKEKEDSKKKDAALRKYESFYREVKARSAQKAAQRQRENQQRQQQARNSARFPK